MISVLRTAHSSARSCFPGTNKEQRILEKRHTKEKTNILDPLKLNVPQYQVRLLSCRQSQSRAAGSKAECSPKRLVVSFAKSKNLFICLYVFHSLWRLSDSEDIVLLTHTEKRLGYRLDSHFIHV